MTTLWSIVFFFFGVVNDSSKKGLKHERTSKCHPGQGLPYSNVQEGVIFATYKISQWEMRTPTVSPNIVGLIIVLSEYSWPN